MALMTTIERPNEETGELEALELKWNMWIVQCMIVAKCRDDKLPEALMFEDLVKLSTQLDNVAEELDLNAEANQNDLLKVYFDSLQTSVRKMESHCNDAMWKHINAVGLNQDHRVKQDYHFDVGLREGETLPKWFGDQSTLDLKEGDVLWMNIAARDPKTGEYIEDDD